MDALTIAEIRIVGFGFNPRDTTYCAGQLLPIMDYQAVYALVGDYYGGDARVTFGVPDLRGRFPLGATGGTGPGLPPYQLGDRGGNWLNNLHESNLAKHTHTATFTSSGTPISADVTVNAHIGKGDSNDAGGKYWATGEAKDGLNAYPVESGYSSTTNTTMASNAVEVEVSGGGSAGGDVEVEDTGSSAPFSIQNPYQGVNYVFALDGMFPARN
jgi:microcystin-dependent protein